MASITFCKSDELTDEVFYYLFQIEVVKIIGHFNSVFSDFFEGEFFVTADKYNPNVRYIKKPGEKLQVLLLEIHVKYLNEKMREIAETLSGLIGKRI